MKVGDYVRTDNGLIGKIIGFKGDMIETDNKRLITYKSNHNECKIKEKPIDLIEEGDYVNGKEVFTLIDNQEPKLVATEDGCLNNNDIKTIITKEKLSSVEYRIGE